MFGVYISFFLMVTLMILVAATWTGLYLAKRITRPIQMLAAAARDIGAGHLDHRLEPETSDEFGSLVEAFNVMAGELSHSRQDLERSTRDLQRQHQEAEARRRYIETVLERITTGVVSVDAGGLVTTINSAAARLLGLGEGGAGRPVAELLGRPELAPLARADRARATRRRRSPRRRRSRWPSKAASCTWPPPPRGCTARAARAKGRCWSSTTSRRSSARRRSPRGARSPGAWPTRSRTP